jgi:hypothetical protein
LRLEQRASGMSNLVNTCVASVLACGVTRIALVLMALVWPGLALADKVLSGEDAAYIDWGANNCGIKSTDKEHAMVDQANAKDAAGFLRKYQGKDLSDALSSPSKQEAMCADIKAWYGPSGSRIADLIKWESAPAASTSDKPAATSTGRKGRRRSSQ